MPGADDLMMRIYAVLAQKERELISERTRAALSAAKARGKALGGDRGYRPATVPDPGAAALARRVEADGTGHRLAMEVDVLRQALSLRYWKFWAQALTATGVPTTRGIRPRWPTQGAARMS